jgi:GNAT superfamily N-acetyltransferase
MDSLAVRAVFDEQLRRHPELDAADATIERDDRVIRSLAEDGWQGVCWSDLDETNADEVIAAQLRRFGELGRDWEWKHYSYDTPDDLPERLRAAGFVPEPSETLLVAAIADLSLDVEPPTGIELRPVVDASDVAALVAVHDAVFGGDHTATGRRLLNAMERRPDSVSAVIAWAGDVPVSGGRIEFYTGSDFAGIWGGGTLPEWRRHGVFRALVAHRAALAASRGFRYLQVDASADSCPILRRLGFTELATTTPFTHQGTAT